MAICLHIHFRHDFSDWGNHDRSVEFLKAAAENLRASFGLTQEQMVIRADSDDDIEEFIKNMESESETDERAWLESIRYWIAIADPLWIDCHLEKGFWAITTCEAYSWLFDDDSKTLEFVKQIVRALGGHTAYVTEELCGWFDYGDGELSFDDWLKTMQNPFVIEV